MPEAPFTTGLANMARADFDADGEDLFTGDKLVKGGSAGELGLRGETDHSFSWIRGRKRSEWNG